MPTESLERVAPGILEKTRRPMPPGSTAWKAEVERESEALEPNQATMQAPEQPAGAWVHCAEGLEFWAVRLRSNMPGKSHPAGKQEFHSAGIELAEPLAEPRLSYRVTPLQAAWAGRRQDKTALSD